MASGKPSMITNEDLPYKRKRYTIVELLEMRHTLPYVCCPVKNFKPEAWSERILIKEVLAGDFLDFNAKHTINMLASRLDDTRRQELLNRQQKEDALNRLIINKRQQNRGYTPSKPRVMPTILEVPSPVTLGPPTRLGTPAMDESVMRSVSLNAGLYGGYGKRILPTVTTNNGLMTSMHAFVPGGTLKTNPITAVDAGDGSHWDTQDTRGIHQTSTTLNLSDDLGYRNISIRVPSPIAVPAATITAKKSVPAIAKVGGVKYREVAESAATVKAKVGTAIKEVIKTVVKTEDDKPPVIQAKALMGKRSTSAEQLNWIQAMINTPIVSASQKAPQAKEALGAFIDTPEGTGQFVFRTKEVGILDELHDAKAAIISNW